MNDLERRNTLALMQYLHADFETWKKGEEAKQIGLWNPPITEKDYCNKRLGVPYVSFNHWKLGDNPVGKLNALKIAVSLGDPKPLEIMGFDPIPEDLWDIVVRLPATDPERRAKIRSILQGGERQALSLVQGG